MLVLRRLTAATICRAHGWDEDIHEGIADHHRPGGARLPRLARLATGRAGRAGRGERPGHVPSPVVRGASREASPRPVPLRDPPDQARGEAIREQRAVVRPRFATTSVG